MPGEPLKLILIYIVSFFFFQMNVLSPLVSDFANNTVSYANKISVFLLRQGKKCFQYYINKAPTIQ